MTGLNLSGEFGEHRLTLQGVKVQKTLAERFGPATRSPCHGCGAFPQHQEHAVRMEKLALWPSPTLRLEALGACWPCVLASIKGGSKPL